MDIEKLLIQPESKTLEFKRDFSSLGPILKTIVAFANTSGGVLIIGCSDHGDILGLKDVLKEEGKLANAIADNIHPPILPEIEIKTCQGKNLLIVKVAHWKGPFYIKREGVPNGVYMRLGSTSRVAGPELISEMQRSASSLSYDQGPLPDLTVNSLDLEKIEKIFNGRGKEVNQDKLRSFGVLVPYGGKLVPSIGGLVLFGKSDELQTFLPDARVNCARFLGDNKANILDRYEVEGTILDALDTVPKFIARNTRLTAKFEGLYRHDIAEYPALAVREVLINALVHNDYSIIGSHIQIAIFDDRLEIQNPGMLPFGFTMEDLKSGLSRIRNRVIARVFHELKLMETWGSGYKRCVDDCRENDYPMPEWKELGTFVRVIFSSHEKTHLVFKEEQVPYRAIPDDLLDRQVDLLALLKQHRSLSIKEIAELLPKTIPERTIRYDLAGLRSRKLVASIGKGRATRWKLL